MAAIIGAIPVGRRGGGSGSSCYGNPSFLAAVVAAIVLKILGDSGSGIMPLSVSHKAVRQYQRW